ncbi:ankyrin repeat [Fusarium heterosporum]|uniref:Ankyrin repeat n=1 Tax=Fusarium heterosporum TaxID=42747 RepID=A0A8H5TEI5_FUSHE|nr:ankyrin repeat [Fusarium heterosporum]
MSRSLRRPWMEPARLARQSTWKDEPDDPEETSSSLSQIAPEGSLPGDVDHDQRTEKDSVVEPSKLLDGDVLDLKGVEAVESFNRVMSVLRSDLYTQADTETSTFVVGGLDGKYERSVAHLRTVTLEAVERSATELLEFIRLKHDEFKATLCDDAKLATNDDLIGHTTHIFFFGTPHRASDENPWELTMDNLVSKLSKRGPNFHSHQEVRRVSALHALVAADFDALCRRSLFQIRSYFQKSDASGLQIVVPESSAILGINDELQIGCYERHEMLADVSRSNVKTPLLLSLKNAQARMDSDYRSHLHILSEHDGMTLLSGRARPIYKSECLKITSSDRMRQFLDFSTGGLGSITNKTESRIVSSTSTTNTGPEMPLREMDSVARSIQILELQGSDFETANFQTSLKESIREQQSGDCSEIRFITVAHHSSSRNPLTKLDLLLSIARQYLIICPQMYRQVEGILGDLSNAFKTQNNAWKETSVWRAVQTFLGCSDAQKAFILMVEPINESLSPAFTTLASDLVSLLRHTEVSCKILIIRKAMKCQKQTSAEIKTQSAHILSSPQSTDQGDRESNLRQAIGNNSWSSLLRSCLAQFLGRAQLLSTEQCLSIISNHHLSSLPPFEVMSSLETDRCLLDIVLDSVPTQARPWFKSGMMWVTYATRPLTHSELSAVLMMGSENTIFTDIRFKHFLKVLVGLVEDDGDKTYPATTGARTLLSQSLTGRQSQLKISIDEADDIETPDQSGFTSWYHIDCHPDLVIIQKCIEILRSHFSEMRHETDQEGEGSEGQAHDLTGTCQYSKSKSQGSDQSPLLSYAIKELFTHVHLWCGDYGDATNEQQLPEELHSLIESFSNPGFINCLLSSLRSMREKPLEQHKWQGFPNIVTLLDLDIKSHKDLSRFVRILHYLSNTDLQLSESYCDPFIVILTQLGEIEALKIFDDHALGPVSLADAFCTGSDMALCHLTKLYPEYVRENLDSIVGRAISLNDLGLLHALVQEYETTPLSDLTAHEVLDNLAKIGRSSLSENSWHILRSFYNSMSTAATPNVFSLAARLGKAITPELLMTAQDLSKEYSAGDTPLLLASKHGDFSIFVRLLASGADPSICDEASRTPLHIASSNGYLDIVKFILSSESLEVDIHAADGQGNTALHLSIKGGHFEVAAEILGSFPETTNSSGPTCLDSDSSKRDARTALILATKHGNVEIMKRLIQYGVEVTIVDQRRQSLVHLAAANPNYVALETLLTMSNPDVNAQDRMFITPLHIASSCGLFDMTKMLLSKKADCNSLEIDGRTPLSIACSKGRIEDVRMMLFNCDSDNLKAGFLNAASAGFVDVAELLLDHGADGKAIETETGKSALHLAVENFDVPMVQALLIRRAALDLRDKNGQTPLHVAASFNSADCLKLLVKAGADLTLSDHDGTTAFSIAVDNNHERCIDILLSAQADTEAYKTGVVRKVLDRMTGRDMQLWNISDEKLSSILRGDIEVISKLRFVFESGVDVDRYIGDDGTMLHYAVLLDRPDLVALLIERKADLDIEHQEHGTPLHLAAANGKAEAAHIVKKLLQAGADVYKGTATYGSPLHAAASMPRHNGDVYYEVVRAIFDKDPGTLHHEGGHYPTVLQAAVATGTESMVKLILELKPKQEVVTGTYGTPLHLAIRTRVLSKALLLEQYLGNTIKDQEGRLPHHLACENRWESIHLFAAIGTTTPLATDLQGRHMFHFFAGHGHESGLNYMLYDNRDAINDRDIDGWTPLHWACRHRNLDAIELLLENGAECNAVTVSGLRPYDVAVYHCVDFNDNTALRDQLKLKDEHNNASSLSKQDHYLFQPAKKAKDDLYDWLSTGGVIGATNVICVTFATNASTTWRICTTRITLSKFLNGLAMTWVR